MTTKQENIVRCAVVMDSAAAMPSSCWGSYRKVAAVVVDAVQLVELDQYRPKMISSRARGMVEILDIWDRMHSGGPKSAAAKAEIAAQEMCDDWNAKLGSEANDGLQLLQDYYDEWYSDHVPEVFTSENTQGYSAADLHKANVQLERARRDQRLRYDNPDFDDLYKALQEKVLGNLDRYW